MNTHVRERESHARLFIEVTPELRRVLEMVAAAAAIDALDQIDADPDLEDDGAEPDDTGIGDLDGLYEQMRSVL